MTVRSLFGRKLEYLFSFDLDLAWARRGPHRAVAPGGVITSQAHDFATLRDADKPLVYNAHGESRVLSDEALTGRVEFAQDTIRYVPQSDFADVLGRVVLKTDDQQTIQGEYTGVVRAGRSWYALRSGFGDARVSELKRAAVETKAHVRIRFETGSTKYRWIVGYQCVGFGRFLLCHGEPAAAMFDIYALDEPVLTSTS